MQPPFAFVGRLRLIGTMARPDRIEGYAIVSAEGMIADANGVQPDALKPEADQKFFYGALDKADAVANGAKSYEGGPPAAERPRLILTRRIAAVGREPGNPNAVLWNPAGADFEEAWGELGLSGGLLAIIGGCEVFGLFLRLGYDAFHLTRAGHVSLPGGRPVFPGVPAQSPETLLKKAGLKPGPAQMLDAATELSLVTWRR
jgi:dihydrofolate reductase